MRVLTDVPETTGAPRVTQRVRSLGLSVAGHVFDGGPPSIFLDCVRCDQSIVWRFDHNRDMEMVSDETAAKVFLSYGWSIKPTLCPDCRKDATP